MGQDREHVKGNLASAALNFAREPLLHIVVIQQYRTYVCMHVCVHMCSRFIFGSRQAVQRGLAYVALILARDARLIQALNKSRERMTPLVHIKARHLFRRRMGRAIA